MVLVLVLGMESSAYPEMHKVTVVVIMRWEAGGLATQPLELVMDVVEDGFRVGAAFLDHGQLAETSCNLREGILCGVPRL